MALSYFQRIAEEKIREAQEAGAFDNLAGQGKPLKLEDPNGVPEELRMAYHILKNAQVLPPEVELLREIHTLQDLLGYIQDESERKVVLRDIQWKMLRLDLIRRRSFSMGATCLYRRTLVRKFRRE